MKTGLGIQKKLRRLNIRINIFRFWLRKVLLGFELANQFIQRIDKYSLHRILLKYGATIGENCDIETGLIFHNCKDYSNLTVGDNSHIGKNCFFDLEDKIVLGSNCVISMRTTLITHIDVGNSYLNKNYPSSKAPIRIGDNCFVGASSTIVKGVRINDGGFITAGSVVTKDIEKNTMVGGTRAKLIKKIN